MGYLDKALETMQKQGDRIVNHDLLDATLGGIGKEYKPGLLAWIRTEYRHSRWKEMLSLEDEINRTTLAGDETGLKAALSTYKAFFQEMLEIYEKAEGLPLYG